MKHYLNMGDALDSPWTSKESLAKNLRNYLRPGGLAHIFHAEK